MSILSQNTLKLIKERSLKPRPRLFFLLKNYIFWTIFALAVILGSLAVTTILFMVTSHDWDVYKYLDRSLFEYIFISLPYLWLIIFAAFIWLAYYYFHHTKHGYRYGFWVVTGLSLISSLGLGGVLFSGGLDSEIHQLFSRQVAVYNKLVYTKQDIWRQAEKGLLAGEITAMVDENSFMVRDLDGENWYVINKADDSAMVIQPGIKLKLLGELEDDGSFKALYLREWNDRW